MLRYHSIECVLTVADSSASNQVSRAADPEGGIRRALPRRQEFRSGLLPRGSVRRSRVISRLVSVVHDGRTGPAFPDLLLSRKWGVLAVQVATQDRDRSHRQLQVAGHCQVPPGGEVPHHADLNLGKKHLHRQLGRLAPKQRYHRQPPANDRLDRDRLLDALPLVVFQVLHLAALLQNPEPPHPAEGAEKLSGSETPPETHCGIGVR